MKKKKDLHAASSVAQDKKGRVQELGRGSCSKNPLQSPKSSQLGSPSGVTSLKTKRQLGASSDVPVATASASAVASTSASAVDTENVSGLALSSNTGSSSGVVAGSGQQHAGGESSAGARLTKNQKRNLNRRLSKARRAQRTPSSGSGAGVKRSRPAGSTPSPDVRPALQKRLREDVRPQGGNLSGRGGPPMENPPTGDGDRPMEELQPCSYAQAAKSMKMAIVKKDFPADKLSSSDSDDILRKILDVIDSTPDGGILPVIEGNTFNKGALTVSCGDSATVEWIRSNFDGVTLGGMALKVLSANELPRPVKVAFRTREKFSEPDVLLRRLQRFNPWLKSTEWRVLNFTSGPSSARWIFEVDSEDAEAIREGDCRALTGVDRGFFKILHDPNKKTDREETTVPVTPPVLMETEEVSLAPMESDQPSPGEPVETEALSPGSSLVSTIGTSEALGMSDLALDSGSEGTLRSDSPGSIAEIDKALESLEGDPSSPSHSG